MNWKFIVLVNNKFPIRITGSCCEKQLPVLYTYYTGTCLRQALYIHWVLLKCPVIQVVR